MLIRKRYFIVCVKKDIDPNAFRLQHFLIILIRSLISQMTCFIKHIINDRLGVTLTGISHSIPYDILCIS